MAQTTTPLNRFALLSGAAICGLSVALGAFGAHAIADQLTADRLATWQTAAKYLMNHGLALLLVGGLSALLRQPLRLPAYLLFAGASVFSASLFLLVVLNLPILGAVAPIGGLLMIAGWTTLVAQLYRNTH